MGKLPARRRVAAGKVVVEQSACARELEKQTPVWEKFGKGKRGRGLKLKSCPNTRPSSPGDMKSYRHLAKHIHQGSKPSTFACV